MHHPQSKYVYELFKIYSDNLVVVVGDSGCGAVDCINEVSCSENIPCVVLDTRKESLSNAIALALNTFGLSKSFWIQLADWNRKLMKKDSILTEYVHSLSEERLIGLFGSLLLKCPLVNDSRSCSVIVRCSSIANLTEHDSSLLTQFQKNFPSVFFFLTCSEGPLSAYEEIPHYTQSFFVHVLLSIHS